MNKPPSKTKVWLFRIVAAIWMVIAIPIALFSFLLLEMPLWPSFGPESTPEGIALWAVLATWFYVTPVVLLIIGRRWNERSDSRAQAPKR
jgi:uncharacterized RDD family membrane protein YckC